MCQRFVLIVLMVASVIAVCKDKPVITIQVVSTDAPVRDVAIHHAATAATSTTNCNTNGNTNGTATTYGNTTTVDANTTAYTQCNTNIDPGRPAYTSHMYVQQEYVHAIMPDGQHVTLWCQAGFRKCASLAAGTYQAEADGDKAVRIYVYSWFQRK